MRSEGREECRDWAGGEIGAMWESFGKLVQPTLLFAVIFALTALGISLARRFRDRTADDGPGASELLANFRELHDQGGLSDEEFRTIKTKLAGDVKSEVNNNRGAG